MDKQRNHPAQGLEQFPQFITPWDLFAASALQGLIAGRQCTGGEEYVSRAVQFANEMMKQREFKNDDIT